MLGVNGSRRLLKGWNDHSLFAALCQRIAAGACDLTEGEGHLPRFSQGHQLAAALANVAALALNDRSQHPALCARRFDDQIKPIAVGIASRLRNGPDPNRGKRSIWMFALCHRHDPTI